MFKTLHLGRLLGINIYIHWTFWFLAMFVAVTSLHLGFAGALAAVGFIFAVFVCVFLHEMGHAIAGTWFGIRTREIVLLPIGGIASMSDFPKKPLPELVVALAGPAVNIAIAALLLLVISMKLAWSQMGAGGIASLGPLEQLLIANLSLAVFNMIPAFPMDGGRVLRALLAIFMTYSEATRYAVRVGQISAVMMCIAGFYYWSFSLVLISGLMFLLSTGELLRNRVQEQFATMQDEAEDVAYRGSFPQNDSADSPFDVHFPKGSTSSNTVDAVEVKQVR